MKVHFVVALLGSVLFAVVLCGRGPYEWMKRDAFDATNDHISSVNQYNCYFKSETDLTLESDTVTQAPRYNELKTKIFTENRTNLLHLHNMALNRAMFYSYMLQNMKVQWQDKYLPGLFYYYFSAVADVAANPAGINGSAVFYDNNCSYPNWYPGLRPFNTTLDLFGPRAYRIDDYNEPTNWIREPTNNTMNIVDYATGTNNNYTRSSYKINEWYNFWLPDLNLQTSTLKQQYNVGVKFSNFTGKFNTKEFTQMNFFGPTSPGLNTKELSKMPVRFTKPYFDCKRANKWIVSAASPIIDYMPRYIEEFHNLRRSRFVGVVVLDIDFLKIDINQCPLSQGNDPPNRFAGTAHCKKRTLCEPMPGYGFQRGGYHCVCRPGFRYPFYQRQAYLGLNIEQSTRYEYEEGFDCITIGLRRVNPIQQVDAGAGTVDSLEKRRKREISEAEFDLSMIEKKKAEIKEMSTEAGRVRRAAQEAEQRSLEWNRYQEAQHNRYIRSLMEKKINQRRKLLARFKRKEESKKRKRRSVPRYESPFNAEPRKKVKLLSRHKREMNLTVDAIRGQSSINVGAVDRMEDILKKKAEITAENCKKMRPDQLILPGDVAYGSDVVFESQARTALRLAHFISMFLQNMDIPEDFGNIRGDRSLTVDQLFGEVIANVMGDFKIHGSGVYYDQDQFRNRNNTVREFFGPFAWSNSADGLSFRAQDEAGLPEPYIYKSFFRDIKARWASNTYGLTKYTLNPMVRPNPNTTSTTKFEHFPLYYRGPSLDDGLWSAPYFDCDGPIKDWILTYSVPFFGLNILRTNLEFKGVVTVQVKLDDLVISQCPQPFYIANAFKNTAKCDYESQVCIPLERGYLLFKRGGYKCECRQGYEYPFADVYSWYFDGQTMEAEYRKMQEGEFSRYYTLKCRQAGASAIAMNTFLVALLAAAASFFNR